MEDTNQKTMNELNALRRTTKNRAIFGTIGMILFVIIVNLIIDNFLGIILSVAAFIGLGFLVGKPYIEYRNRYKEVFVQTSLAEIFENLNYQPDYGIDRNIIKDTKMMHMGNRYSSNDYIEADYNGVHFKQADVCIQDETEDSDGHSHTETLFRGRWMIFDFNKEFKANLQVVQKGFKNAKRKRFFGKEEEKYKKVEMEDVQFNNEFKVFAQDAHDAFYILTPQMMDRIRKVSDGVKGTLIFCFIGNVLHIGIHTNKDSFEPGLMKEMDMETEKQKIINDINLITNFINELSLDTKLFKL